MIASLSSISTTTKQITELMAGISVEVLEEDLHLSWWHPWGAGSWWRWRSFRSFWRRHHPNCKEKLICKTSRLRAFWRQASRDLKFFQTTIPTCMKWMVSLDLQTKCVQAQQWRTGYIITLTCLRDWLYYYGPLDYMKAGWSGWQRADFL